MFETNLAAVNQSAMSQNTEESVKTTSNNTTESWNPRTIEAVEDTEQEIKSDIASDQTDGDNSQEMPEWGPREMLGINHEVCQIVHCGAGAVEYDTESARLSA